MGIRAKIQSMSKHNNDPQLENQPSTWKDRLVVKLGLAGSGAVVAGVLAVGLSPNAADKPPVPTPDKTSQTTPTPTPLRGDILTPLPKPTKAATPETPAPAPATPDSDPTPSDKPKDKGPKKDEDKKPVDLGNDMDIITEDDLTEDDLKPDPTPSSAPTAESNPEEIAQ